ncbi:MAG: dephospho-CoA kinase [Myxococcota bacterium]|nr:dephospho-CoA kinase [Myxococcota bacterium]
MTKIVGLTGGIGTGKSTVARMLTRLGAAVIDADSIVHELQAPGTPLLRRIVEDFGEEVLRPDGSLDRARLGRRVFQDPEARQRLNRLVHPAVGAEMARRLETARRGGARLVVLDIPLLLEGRARGGGAGELVEEVIVVYAPERVQIERQMERDGATREEAQARVRAQMPIEEKRRLADHVIDNSGSLDATRRQVRALFARLVGGAEHPEPAA